MERREAHSPTETPIQMTVKVTLTPQRPSSRLGGEGRRWERETYAIRGSRPVRPG